jgi:hypothetical protein
MTRPEAFAKALAEAGATVTSDYSGRYMYGDRCVGVTVKSIGDLLEAVYWLGRQDLDGNYQADIAHADMDSLGRGSIIYWREMQTGTGSSEEDEESEALDSV